jgi:hypothetical protein
MGPTWGRREMHVGFWWGKVNERDRLKYVRVDGKGKGKGKGKFNL